MMMKKLILILFLIPFLSFGQGNKVQKFVSAQIDTLKAMKSFKAGDLYYPLTAGANGEVMKMQDGVIVWGDATASDVCKETICTTGGDLTSDVADSSMLLRTTATAKGWYQGVLLNRYATLINNGAVNQGYFQADTNFLILNTEGKSLRYDSIGLYALQSLKLGTSAHPWDSAFIKNIRLKNLSGSGTVLGIDINGNVIKTSGGSGMTYPGSGIALSNGSEWSGSITNNSTAWNNARAISNHDSLGNLDEKSYNSLSDKPTLNLAAWNNARAISNHDSLGNLDEKSYNSLSDKPTLNLAAWNNARAISNHDSLSTLDEKSYNSLTDKPTIPAAVDTTTAGTGLVNKTRMSHTSSYPTLNQNTTGTAAGLTSQYIDWNSSSGGSSIANKPTLQTIISGTGFVKASGTSLSYDNSTYLTAETDPNVSAWAKAASKPSYTYSEVGAEPAIGIGTTNQMWIGNKTWQTIPTSSQWTTSGSNIYYNTGNIGINTTNPTAKLHITGSLIVSSGITNNNKDTTSVVLFFGDSMTVGYDGTNNFPPSDYVTVPTWNGTPFVKYNYGQGGLKAVEMDSVKGLYAFGKYANRSGKNIMVVWIGINDFFHNRTPGQVLSSLSAFCTKYKGWGYKVIVCTLPAQTSNEVNRDAYNVLIRKSYSTFADGVADLAANDTIGADGASSNATYFPDGLHLSETGSHIAARVIQAALVELITNERNKHLNNVKLDTVTIANYAPIPSAMTGSLMLGNGGKLLSHSTGSEGYYNLFMGVNSGLSTTSGYGNTGISNSSLYTNSTGNNNTSIGYGSMFYNTTGSGNTAIGLGAQNHNTTGPNNTAIGFQALYNNTSGYANVAIGLNAGMYAGSGTTANATGNLNVFLGYNSRPAANGDTNEIALGHSVTGNGSGTVTIGNEWITKTYLSGSLVLPYISSAKRSKALFYDPSTKVVSYGDTTFGGSGGSMTYPGVGIPISTGSTWGTSLTGSDGDYVKKVGGVWTTGTITGGSSQWSNNSNKIYYNTDNVGIGTSNPGQQLELTASLKLPETTSSTTGVIYKGSNPFIHNFAEAGTGGLNTFVGVSSGNFTMHHNGDTVTQASYNTGMGEGTLTDNTTGYDNTAVGYWGLRLNTRGWGNTASGYGTLSSNTTGNENTAVGLYGLNFNTTGIANVAVGSGSLQYNTIGQYNTAMGYHAANTVTTGSRNTSVGKNALNSTTTGQCNTSIGNSAGYYNVAGDSNTFIGSRAGSNSVLQKTDAVNSMALGSNSYTTASNQFVYGNFNVTQHLFRSGKIGVGTTNPLTHVDAINDIGITGTTPTLYFGKDGTSNYVQKISFWDNGAEEGYIAKSTSNAMRIQNNGSLELQSGQASSIYMAGGKVGIATTTPNAALSVIKSKSTDTLFVARNDKIGSDSAAGILQTGVIFAPGGTSTDWNSAVGWGNHAAYGYLVNPMTTTGDVVYMDYNSGGDPIPARLEIGNEGNVLTVHRYLDHETPYYQPVWAAPATPSTVANPLTVGSYAVTVDAAGHFPQKSASGWDSQTAHNFLIGPATPGDAAPTFRLPVLADLDSTKWVNFNDTAATGGKISTKKNLIDGLAGKAATNQAMYLGTTSVAINRGTGALSLAGVSIDGASGSCTGNAATVTNGFYTTNLKTDSHRSTSTTSAYNAVTANAVMDSIHALSVLKSEVLTLAGGGLDSTQQLLTGFNKMYMGYSSGMTIDTILLLGYGAAVNVTFKVKYSASMADTGYTVVYAGNAVSTANVPTKISTFNRTTIPKGNVVWFQLTAITTKCRYVTALIKGHRL